MVLAHGCSQLVCASGASRVLFVHQMPRDLPLQIEVGVTGFRDEEAPTGLDIEAMYDPREHLRRSSNVSKCSRIDTRLLQHTKHIVLPTTQKNLREQSPPPNSYRILVNRPEKNSGCWYTNFENEFHIAYQGKGFE